MDTTINKNQNEEAGFPFFSVIITTYNRAELLARALKSLIGQTETNWECIIIDDGSTDNTLSVVSPYLRAYPKITYFKEENKGYAAAKNTGILLSKGEFVTFLDSDDEYVASHLESRKAILTNNKTIDFLHGGSKIIGNQYVPDRFDYKKMIHLSDCVIAGTFFMRRELAISSKGFADVPIGGDRDLFEKISHTGVIIMKTDIPTYIYHRETNDSITNSFISHAECQ